MKDSDEGDWHVIDEPEHYHAHSTYDSSWIDIIAVEVKVKDK